MRSTFQSRTRPDSTISNLESDTYLVRAHKKQSSYLIRSEQIVAAIVSGKPKPPIETRIPQRQRKRTLIGLNELRLKQDSLVNLNFPDSHSSLRSPTYT